MNFMCEWQRTSQRVMFFSFYRRIDDGVFDDFPKICDHFPEISEGFSKLFRRTDKHSRTVFVNFRKLPKTLEEDLKIFPSNTNEIKYNLRDKLDIIKIIDIFTSEDKENTPPQSHLNKWNVIYLGLYSYRQRYASSQWLKCCGLTRRTATIDKPHFDLFFTTTSTSKKMVSFFQSAS